MKSLIINSKTYGAREVLLDDEDYEKIKAFKWCLGAFNKKGKKFYAVRTSRKDVRGKRKTIYIHKFITGYALVDHINGNTLDNRKENLREATHSQNVRNQGLASHNTSGFKGVVWDKRDKKFRSKIQVKGKTIHLGGYKSKEDAAKAYNEASIKYHGKFGRLNVIKGD